ncbi:hypothetical protein E8E12_000159 [Didymella heteroderae]|uniref:Uncharacterized protein n=1 Tax=Didymella heteroderae TaxID=1769908 RepID=A0A9P4WFL3_9PLEO|nr:hypothetical protein E8E12_000159 [Didymella heteroderae]
MASLPLLGYISVPAGHGSEGMDACPALPAQLVAVDAELVSVPLVAATVEAQPPKELLERLAEGPTEELPVKLPEKLAEGLAEELLEKLPEKEERTVSFGKLEPGCRFYIDITLLKLDVALLHLDRQSSSTYRHCRLVKSSVPNLGFIDETSEPTGITGSSADTVLQLVLVQNDGQVLQADERFRMDKVEEQELLESSDIVVWRNRGLRPDYVDVTKCSVHHFSDDECESEGEGESEDEGEGKSEGETGTMLCE